MKLEITNPLNKNLGEQNMIIQKGDIAGTPNLMANTLYDDSKTQLGASDGQEAIEVLMSKIAELEEKTQNMSPIKSIQRGIVAMAASTKNVDVTLNPIDASKSMVILNSANTGINGSYADCGIVNSLTSTQLKIYTSSNTNIGKIMYISWQVIEFN